MSNKEVYRLNISVGVSGDSEAKSKLSAIEKMAQQTEKKMKALNKIMVSPTAKITDNTSSAISKIKSKASALTNTKINPTAKITDNASNRISEISSKLKRLGNSNISATLKVNDQTSSYLNNVQAKSNKLKNTNINPTAKIADQASAKLDNLNSKVSKFKSANMSTTIKATDEASNKIEKVKRTEDTLKNKSVKIQATDQATTTINKIKNKIDSWVKVGAKKIISIGLAGAVALGGLGIGSSIKTFASFEQGMKNVQAVSGATGSEFEKLTAKAKEMGSTTSFTARDSADAFYYMGMAGWKSQEMLNAIPGVLNLAAAGGTELATTSDIVTDGLTALGLTAKDTNKFVDIMGATVTNSNTSVELMGETLKYVGSMGGALGVSMEDLSLATGLMANASVKGSMAGTALRGGLTRLIKPTKMVKSALSEYDIAIKKTGSGSLDLVGTIGTLRNKLRGLDDVTKSAALAKIFGQEAVGGWAAVINASESDFNKLSNAIANAKGKTEEIAKTRLDSLNGQWTILKSAVEGAKIELGEKLAPYAKQFVTWLTDKMPALTDKIVEMVDYVSKHTDDIKTLATTVIGLGVAFSTLSAVGKIGNTITGITSLLGIIKGTGVASETTAIAGGLSKVGVLGSLLPAIFSPAGLAIAGTVALIGTAIVANNNLMKKSCTTTVEELGPVERIMNKLNGNINKSKSELIEAGLIYDDFGDGVSDSFKKASQDASKSLLKLEMNINRLTTDDKFDDAENNQLKNWVNDMAYEGVNAIKAKQSEIKSELSKTFSLDGVTSTAEQGTLDYMDKFFGEGVNKELEIRDQMYAIGDKAIKDHGKLLEDDLKQLKEKAAQLQAVKLEYANAESAGEKAYAQTKFTSAAERVTGVDGASELLQERAKEHQSSIDETKANYDGTIAKTQYHLDHDQNLSDTDRTNMQNAINENQTARDKALKDAEDAWQSDLATLYDAYPKAKGKLNEKTGAQFSDEDIKRNQTLRTMTGSKFAGLTDAKKSGMYSLINNDTGKYESVYAEVNKATGEVIGAYSYCSGQVGGYTAEMANSAKKSALDMSTSNFQITSSLDTVKSASVNAAGEMIGDGDRLISKLGALQTAQDGTLYRTMSINGTPINVQVDSNGAITNLDEVRQKAEEASKGRSVEITSNTTEETTKMQEYETAREAIPPNTDAHINSNASEVTSQTSGLLGKLQYITSHPWTAFLNFVKGGSSSSDYTHTEQDTYDENRTHLDADGNPYATGTSNATRGYHDTAERGFEIMIGRKKRWFNGGEKVLTHQQSKSFLQNQQNNEPFQVKQGQYQLVQPQMQVAGAGGVSVGDIQVSVNGNQDADGIVQEVVQVVGYKLKEALTNIKK